MSIGLIYARESLRKDDLAIDRQVDLGRIAVRSHHLTPEVHVEAGGHRSGRSDKARPEWRLVKKRLQDPEVKMLWVADISRATRSVTEFYKLIEELKNRKVQLVSHRENFDPNTAAGRMTMSVVASINQWFAEDIAERSAVRTQYLRDKGVPMGTAPQGLKFQGRGTERRLVPDEDQCYTVEGRERTGLDIVQAWLELLTSQSIGVYRGAALLNAQGFRFVGHGGAHLVHPFDLYRLNRILYDSHHPDKPSPYAGVIDAKLLARARARLQGRSLYAQNGPPQRHPSLLLRGIVFCADCHRRYHSGHSTTTATYGDKTYHYDYEIYKHYREDCRQTVVLRAHPLEKQILDKLKCVSLVPPKDLARYAQLAAQPTPDPNAERREFLRAKLLRLEKYLVEGAISEETYKKERPLTETELSQLPPPPTPMPLSADDCLVVFRQVARFTPKAKELDPNLANEMIRSFILRIEMRDRHIVHIEWAPYLQALMDSL